jgi:hypothetical protein
LRFLEFRSNGGDIASINSNIDIVGEKRAGQQAQDQR